MIYFGHTNYFLFDEFPVRCATGVHVWSPAGVQLCGCCAYIMYKMQGQIPERIKVSTSRRRWRGL